MKEMTDLARHSSNPQKWFCLTFIICILAYTAELLCVWPGILSYDSIYQMQQVVGQIPVNNHHPAIYTLFIKLIFRIVSLSGGSISTAVGIYSVIQMVSLAFTYSYITSTLSRKGAPDLYIVALIPFFAFDPINTKYSVTMWKDIFFGMFVLIYTIQLWNISDSIRDGAVPSKRNLTAAAFSGIGFCLFRTNGIIAFAMLAIIIFILYFRKTKKFVLLNFIVLCVGITIIGPLYSIAGFERNDPIESLAIPTQQITAVLKYHGIISESQVGLIDKVVNSSIAAASYIPSSVDRVKTLIRQYGNQYYIEENKIEFIKLWFSLGRQNPGIYIKAYFSLIKGYFVPTNNGLIVENGIWQNSMGISTKEILPDSICNIINGGANIPYTKEYNWVFSIGLIFDMAFLSFITCLAKKKRNNLILFLPSFLLLLTLMLAVPVSGEFRYMFSMFITLPIFIYLPFLRTEARQDEMPGTPIKRSQRLNQQ